jgi:hypothetical protein
MEYSPAMHILHQGILVTAVFSFTLFHELNLGVVLVDSEGNKEVAKTRVHLCTSALLI